MLFPPDALTAIVDTTSVAGTSCGTLIATSTDTYTLLYAQIITDANQNSQILYGTSTLLETETNREVDNFYSFRYANQAITCTRPTGAGNHFTIVYVPRSLSATSTIEYTEINNQPLAIVGTSSVSNLPDTTETFTNTNYIVVLGIILVGILLFDLMRRLFIPKRRL